MKVFLNLKGPEGRETVDELSREDFKSYRDFSKELTRMVHEYALCGMDVYRSRRCCANWRN